MYKLFDIASGEGVRQRVGPLNEAASRKPGKELILKAT